MVRFRCILSMWCFTKWDNHYVPLGLYISVPFCRTKCSYCNFASDVFSKALFQRYVDRVCRDIESAAVTAEGIGASFERAVDTVYVGGGTPTLLDISQLERLFVTVSQNFDLGPGAEITMECAPGTLNDAVVETLVHCGVNRVSLGVQSFVDQEAASVGRLHRRSVVIEDIARLRSAGITNINVDLIAGLPHQTMESWQVSLRETIGSEVPHVSVYMLEIDEDSRLGRELIAGGTKYHAHFVPDEDLTADMYEAACEILRESGVTQYEISNLSRQGFESRHNLKYWTRRPYFGFGVDAHSMLPGPSPEVNAIRFSTPDALEEYVAGTAPIVTEVCRRAALEETFFLGLRLVAGLNLETVWAEAKRGEEAQFEETIADLVQLGLLERAGEMITLTGRGRLLSNEVFARFISNADALT
jgi:oxygen-independent coproporphyrinogen III oxidase